MGERSLMALFFGMMFFCLKLLFKAFMFVGGYWVLIFLAPFLIYELTPLYDNQPYSPFWIFVSDVLVYLALIPMGITTIQNVIRKTTGNKNFKLLNLIKKNNKTKEDPDDNI